MKFKVKDHYFKKAKKENFLARSVYKLEEIDQKHSVLKRNDIVLDLGYHPGSWTQYASQVVGEKGRVYGVDIRERSKTFDKIENVEVVQADIYDLTAKDLIGDELFNVVVSDMAPNTTGMKSVDQARSAALVEKIIELLPSVLKKDGNLVFKIFDGPDVQEIVKVVRTMFKKVANFKPKSTRSISKEFFVIGLGFKGSSEE